jgi:calcineurin-like phosphoesterase
MKKYKIVIGSPIEYEYLTADIVIKDKYIARIQMEEGKDRMLLEFHQEATSEKLEVEVFLQAIQEGRDLLLK